MGNAEYMGWLVLCMRCWAQRQAPLEKLRSCLQKWTRTLMGVYHKRSSLRCANKTKTFSTSFKDAPNHHHILDDADHHLTHDHHHDKIFLRPNSKKKDMMMAFPMVLRNFHER